MSGSRSIEVDVSSEVESEGSALSLERRFDLLKNARRRYVLECLRERHGPVGIGELTEYVAARETDTPPEDLTRRQRKRAYVGLYQCHLPRLDAAGVVWLDTERGVVASGAAAPQLYRYLPPYRSPADRWYRWYLAVAAGGSVLWTASALLVGPGVTPTVVAVLLTTLLVCAIGHVLARARGIESVNLSLRTLFRSVGV